MLHNYLGFALVIMVTSAPVFESLKTPTTSVQLLRKMATVYTQLCIVSTACCSAFICSSLYLYHLLHHVFFTVNGCFYLILLLFNSKYLVVEHFIRVFNFIAQSLHYNSIFYSHLRDIGTEIM